MVAGHISACLHYLYRSDHCEEFCCVAFDVPQKVTVMSHTIQHQGAVILPDQNAAKDAWQWNGAKDAQQQEAAKDSQQ